MAEQRDEPEIERVMVAMIERYPRRNPEALAKQIVAELGRTGRFIVPREPTIEMNTAVAKSRDHGHWGLVSAWRAMVDAAQAKPRAGGSDFRAGSVMAKNDRPTLGGEGRP